MILFYNLFFVWYFFTICFLYDNFLQSIFVSDLFTMFVYGRDACFNCVRTFSFYCSLSAALWYNKSTKAFYPIQLNLFTGVSTHVLQDSYFQTKDISSSVHVINDYWFKLCSQRSISYSRLKDRIYASRVD